MVVIMANIGAGKTVLCKRLEKAAKMMITETQHEFEFVVCHEPVESWERIGMLAQFYKDVKKPAAENNSTPFIFQVNAFSSRLANIARAVRGTQP